MKKQVLTYSALNTYRNCPCKYKHRYVDSLVPKEKPDTLFFGTIIHKCLELWFTIPEEFNRTERVFGYINSQFPERDINEKQKQMWHCAVAMFKGYIKRYQKEEFEVVEIEKEFKTEIRNPATGGKSQTFDIAGKADGIVTIDGEYFLLEHKTAAGLTQDYLDRLWCDTQISLYSFYLRELGYPIAGVLYDILIKTRLKQHQGETEAEYQERKAALIAKSKSGKSSAKRKMPESDEEYKARLNEWHSRPEAYHREKVYLSSDRMEMLQEEVWSVTQQYLQARRHDRWFQNTSYCFQYERPCQYLEYCRSNFNPIVRDNMFDKSVPHEELSTVRSSEEAEEVLAS